MNQEQPGKSRRGPIRAIHFPNVRTRRTSDDSTVSLEHIDLAKDLEQSYLPRRNQTKIENLSKRYDKPILYLNDVEGDEEVQIIDAEELNKPNFVEIAEEVHITKEQHYKNLRELSRLKEVEYMSKIGPSSKLISSVTNKLSDMVNTVKNLELQLPQANKLAIEEDNVDVNSESVEVPCKIEDRIQFYNCLQELDLLSGVTAASTLADFQLKEDDFVAHMKIQINNHKYRLRELKDNLDALNEVGGTTNELLNFLRDENL